MRSTSSYRHPAQSARQYQPSNQHVWQNNSPSGRSEANRQRGSISGSISTNSSIQPVIPSIQAVRHGPTLVVVGGSEGVHANPIHSPGTVLAQVDADCRGNWPSSSGSNDEEPHLPFVAVGSGDASDTLHHNFQISRTQTRADYLSSLSRAMSSGSPTQASLAAPANNGDVQMADII